MVFATFQPLPEHDIVSTEDAVFEEVLGYRPIFCFPARTVDEFAFGCFLSNTALPERIILFETDDFERFDTVKYHALKHSGLTAEKLRECFGEVGEMYAEYVTSEMTNVIHDISLQEFIFETDFASDDNHSIFTIMQRTRGGYDGMLKTLKFAPTDAQKCEFLKIAFSYFSSRFFYSGVMNEVLRFEDTLPFYPVHNNLFATNAFSNAISLQLDIYDKGESTYEAYSDMYQQLTIATASLYEDYYNFVYGRNGRNGLCGCGSGKKFKKCHMKWHGQLRVGV